MGKQVNFFLTASELLLIEKFLADNKLKIIIEPFENKEFVLSNSLSQRSALNPFYFKKYLVLEPLAAQVKVKNLAEKYFIDDLYSPVIEFVENIWQDDFCRVGRLFYETGFYDENGIWQEKDTEFLKAAEKLFRWFRKNFQKSELTFGFYTSPAVLAWVKNGGVLKQV
jgi:hypothetical protein